MIFRKISPVRYRVLTDKDDKTFRGVVEKHSYTTYIDGRKVKREFWLAKGREFGWRNSKIGKFNTREEAGRALLKANTKPYDGQRMAWNKEKEAKRAREQL